MTIAEAGTRIAGRYVLEGRIGDGGMGVVMQARDERLERRVAIKLLPPAAVGDAALRARLLREARSAAAVEHPGIVHVYDVGETDDGGAFLAMELVRGKSFRAVLEEERLTLLDAILVIVEIARTLAFAHRAGLVHRDVKPDNVMIRDDGHAILLDFGIATSVSAARGGAGGSPSVAGAARLTADGAFVGTPAYVAPEQFQGGAVDGRADEFALAVMAHEALTGRLPWKARDAAGIVAELASGGPVALAAFDESLAGMEVVIGRALSKRPEDRYPDLDVFADALSSFVAPPVADRGPLAALTARSHDTALAVTVAATGEPSARVSPGAATVEAPIPGPPADATATHDEGQVPGPAAGDLARERFYRARAGRGEITKVVHPVRRVRAAVACALVALAASAAWWWSHAGRSPDASPGPAAAVLASPEAVLACPPLRASGVAEPSGWLGAAAASLVCLRAQPLLGGRGQRTLVPAELLDLPSQPVDGLPDDPYGEEGAAERARVAAKKRAAAYVDGEVAKGHDEFRVALVVRASDERELGRGAGQGRSLHGAVRRAMEALRTPVFPAAGEPDPVTAGWLGTTTADAALAVTDWEIATSDYEIDDAHEACSGLPQHRAALTPAVFSRLVSACEREVHPATDLRMPAAELPPIDRSSTASFAATVHARLLAAEGPPDRAELAAELRRRFEAEPTARGRATLAMLESQIWQSLGDVDRSRALALASVAADPKRGNDPWFQLLITSLGSVGERQVSRAYAAWAPWSPTAWMFHTGGAADAASRERWMRRGYALSPHAMVARRLAELLLQQGAREEARSIAARLASAGPYDAGDGELLLVRIDTSEARFRAALDRIVAKLPAMAAGPVLTSRDVDLLLIAGALAELLGQRAAYADDLVPRFLDPDPPRLETQNSSAVTKIIGLCMLATSDVSVHCLARLRALFSSGSFTGSTFPSTLRLLDGAQRYARRDFPGAARAWRPLLQSPESVVATLNGPMVDAFERTGELDLAERVDVEALSHAGEYNGATMAAVRAARRAAKRGDGERARKLAEQVIAAWSLADDAVPAVEEMRKLRGMQR